MQSRQTMERQKYAMVRNMNKKRGKKGKNCLFIMTIGALVWSQVFFFYFSWRTQDNTFLLPSAKNDARLMHFVRSIKQRRASSSSSSRIPYETSFICRGCKHSEIKQKRFTCGERVAYLMKKYSRNEREALKAVSKAYTDNCGKCDPDACVNKTKYWRFDHSAPIITSSVTHYLPSIPSTWRVPSERLSNMTEYLAELWQTKSTKMLFEYNPSLVQLPDKMKKEFHFNGKFTPVYLASFRVSSWNSCFKEEDYQMQDSQLLPMRNQNYLGLALLESDLSIIPGSDIVVDMNGIMGGRFFNEIVDFRLYVMNEKMYLNMNGPPVFIVPFTLTSKHISIPFFGKGKAEPLMHDGIKLSNLFGDGMEITLHHRPSTISTEHKGGKNFALFQTEGHDSQLLAETSVLPHTVQRLNPDTLQNVGYRTKSEREPDLSFATVDELWFPQPVFKKFPHGGACCVHINSHQSKHISPGEYLLVGVAHTKIPWRSPEKRSSDLPVHQYVSFFYAFELTPPYHLRARSGYFCLPFANEDTVNLYAKATSVKSLRLKGEEFNCPEISFVSAITEKAGDESKVIISYGINDCIPRMAEVDKSEIDRLLFTNLDK